LLNGDLVNGLFSLLRVFDEQVDTRVTGKLQAVLGAEAVFEVYGATGLKVEVNVAASALVVCA
jgi:hypothetical protein